MNTPPHPTSHHSPGIIRRSWEHVKQFFDSDYFPEGAEAVRNRPDRFEFRRAVPFILLHVGCIGVIWTGWSPVAVVAAVVLYLVRMFAITAFYHRYFSHRTFRTSRSGQFLFAILGNCAIQRGPLWWASVHRHHHKFADQEEDVHSPGIRGFAWSHIGWMTSSRNFPTDYSQVRDLAKYPELMFLNRFDLVVPAAYGFALYLFGAALRACVPSLHTSGWQMFIWGFFVSTVFLLHGTLFINSLAHTLGRRRFQTADDSRNSLILALMTLGEGWHNNHHRYMASARQGFFWWEIDITYYTLKLLSWGGLVWDVRGVPKIVYDEARIARLAVRGTRTEAR